MEFILNLHEYKCKSYLIKVVRSEVLPFLLYRSHKIISENTSILQEIYMWLSVSKLQISEPLKMKKKNLDYIEICNQSIY